MAIATSESDGNLPNLHGITADFAVAAIPSSRVLVPAQEGLLLIKNMPLDWPGSIEKCCHSVKRLILTFGPNFVAVCNALGRLIWSHLYSHASSANDGPITLRSRLSTKAID